MDDSYKIIIEGLKSAFYWLKNGPSIGDVGDDMSQYICNTSKTSLSVIQKVKFLSENGLFYPKDKYLKSNCLVLCEGEIIDHLLNVSTPDSIVDDYKEILKIDGFEVEESDIISTCSSYINEGKDSKEEDKVLKCQKSQLLLEHLNKA